MKRINKKEIDENMFNNVFLMLTELLDVKSFPPKIICPECLRTSPLIIKKNGIFCKYGDLINLKLYEKDKDIITWVKTLLIIEKQIKVLEERKTSLRESLRFFMKDNRIDSDSNAYLYDLENRFLIFLGSDQHIRESQLKIKDIDLL